MPAMSKTERKGAAKGAAAARKKFVERRPMAAATTIGAAWAGQKFLAGAKSPIGDFPLHYALGGAAAVATLFGPLKRPTPTNSLILDAAVGLVAGELAVQASKDPSNVLG